MVFHGTVEIKVSMISCFELFYSEKDQVGQLWTAKYAPKSLSDLCGNKGQVDKLQAWLKDW